MRFKGFMEKHSNLYHIAALVKNEKINNTIVNFVVDTGSTLTILSVKDSIKLKLLSIKEETFELINNYGLDAEKTQTSIGSMDLLKLNDVVISFYYDDKCYFAEYFKAIYVARPVIKNETEYRLMMDIPSILGIDILKNYTISFSNNSVILER
ncbi:MAG: hypothetical protein ACTHME_00750 [Candidatus Nitrosocosmicus sp.]